jgi:hypothetical protein
LSIPRTLKTAPRAAFVRIVRVAERRMRTPKPRASPRSRAFCSRKFVVSAGRSKMRRIASRMAARKPSAVKSRTTIAMALVQLSAPTASSRSSGSTTPFSSMSPGTTELIDWNSAPRSSGEPVMMNPATEKEIHSDANVANTAL